MPKIVIPRRSLKLSFVRITDWFDNFIHKHEWIAPRYVRDFMCCVVDWNCGISWEFLRQEMKEHNASKRM